MTKWRNSRCAELVGAERLQAATRVLRRGSLRTAFVASALLLAANTVLATDSEGNTRPDFSGTWERFPDPYDPNSRFPEDPPAPDGGPKLKKKYAIEYKKLNDMKAEGLEKGLPVTTPSTQCLPEGMPGIMGAVHPIEILQTPKQIVVLAEFLTQTRRIYLNEEMPPVEDIFPGYNGYSVGHWEGDTLVVHTVGIREDVKFFEIPRSETMEITERLRLTGPDLLENRVTIDDPEVLVKPYEFTFGYRRNPDYRIMEYICDNNRYHTDEDGDVSLDMSL